MTYLNVPGALRSACHKGHNWIKTRACKIRTLNKGYNKIRPKILPKGLTEFKKEHCITFDEDCNDIFLKCHLESCLESNTVENTSNDMKINYNTYISSDLNGLKILMTRLKIFIYLLEFFDR